MWLTKDEFRIKAENFDLSNGFNIIRVICGLFLFPHVAGKFAGGLVSPGTAGFFAKADFHPPEVWLYIAALSETAAGLALVFGICTRFAALGAQLSQWSMC
jgi:putative oxidoreductase